MALLCLADTMPISWPSICAFPKKKFIVCRLVSICPDYPSLPRTRTEGVPTIGYLARLCPEKGLHILVDAFIDLHGRAGFDDLRLRVAGWLSKDDRDFSRTQFDKIRAAGYGDDFDFVGTVDRREKLAFLCAVDVISVPTVYRDPKGLYVLEALACGTPVVQPSHGAFSELLSQTGGGRLFRPNDARQLADALHEVLSDERMRDRTGQRRSQERAREVWRRCDG